MSSQLTGSHAGAGNSPATLAAQLVSQQLLMHGSLGTLSSQEIQTLASTLQQQQQSLQQHLQQIAMFHQANPATGQLPAQAQFFLQNQVCPIFFSYFLVTYIHTLLVFFILLLKASTRSFCSLFAMHL